MTFSGLHSNHLTTANDPGQPSERSLEDKKIILSLQSCLDDMGEKSYVLSQRAHLKGDRKGGKNNTPASNKC